MANSFSKAALRVCVEKLREDYPQVDYLPSYEMATSGGLDVFIEDNVHVRRDVVDVITRYMLRAYFPNLAPGASKDTEGLVSGAQA